MQLNLCNTPMVFTQNGVAHINESFKNIRSDYVPMEMVLGVNLYLYSSTKHTKVL